MANSKQRGGLTRGIRSGDTLRIGSRVRIRFRKVKGQLWATIQAPKSLKIRHAGSSTAETSDGKAG